MKHRHLFLKINRNHQNEKGSWRKHKLIYAGANHWFPKCQGLAEATTACSLRNVPWFGSNHDCFRDKLKKATVIGAGFIGLEIRELKNPRVEVTVIRKPHALPPLDEEWPLCPNELIRTVYGWSLGNLRKAQEQGKTITPTNGEKVASDLTILSVGFDQKIPSPTSWISWLA